MIRTLIVIFMLGLSTAAVGQTVPADSIETAALNHLTGYLGLRPGDIAFRPDYTEPDSFRLKLIDEYMQSPLKMIDYAEGFTTAHVVNQPEIIAAILKSDLVGSYQTDRTGAYRPAVTELQPRYNLHYTNVNLNQLLNRAVLYLDIVFPKSTEMALARLSADQRRFLLDEFKELLVSHVEEENMTIMQSDSVENAEEETCKSFVDFGTKIDTDPIVDAGLICLRELMIEIRNLRDYMAKSADGPKKIVDAGYLPPETDASSFLGKQPGWIVGGPGNDYYHGDYKFILDVGGDDVYDLSYDPANPHGVIIIDYAGDDRYASESDFTLGSGCLSVGLLIDLGGNDRYDARSFALGSGYFGFGLLYDAAGDDRYEGDTHVQGAGTFGLGLLIDEGGRDSYNGALFAQGFGFVDGLGLIFERNGSDIYYAGGKYQDILRYDVHYLSLSQGFGYGLRPYMSGGIGGIVDLDGNDLYYSDIFGQGASYWWSLGFIYDSAGNDNYQSFQYAQGAATHMTLGVLIDEQGSDVYFSKGVSQGCGHDYSCGVLLDRDGNDTYTAYDLSQAAGSANGVGLLIDSRGDDRYFIKNPANSQGYGNPRRDFGSLGLFFDAGGEDQYDGNGRNNWYWRNGKWGGGADVELIVADTTEERSGQ